VWLVSFVVGNMKTTTPNRKINPEIAQEISRRLADAEREHNVRIP
jgi:hypothetical protein